MNEPNPPSRATTTSIRDRVGGDGTMPAPQPAKQDGDSTTNDANGLGEAELAKQLLEEPINDDNREKYDWKHKYPIEARKMIRTDAIYVSATLAISLIGVLTTWRGDLLRLVSYDCYQCSVGSFNQYSYVFFDRLLGGSLYGIKYLYKVVARGYWNADRRLWRVFSPPLAAGLALATGAFFQAGVFGFSLGSNTTVASYFSLGFITGYFADRAIGKMQEIAETVFGDPQSQYYHLKKRD